MFTGAFIFLGLIFFYLYRLVVTYTALGEFRWWTAYYFPFFGFLLFLGYGLIQCEVLPVVRVSCDTVLLFEHKQHP